jgi:predicted methyltransferase MtxX (methanogen marker protein 4)
MNRYNMVFAAVATTFIAGCAAPGAPVPVSQDDKTFVTGSRLPSRDGETTNSVSATANQSNINDAMQRGNIVVPPKGGPR